MEALEPIYETDMVVGPHPTAWIKVQNMMLHVIELEKKVDRLEKELEKWKTS